jgi:hypothetical protein
MIVVGTKPFAQTPADRSPSWFIRIAYSGFQKLDWLRKISIFSSYSAAASDRRSNVRPPRNHDFGLKKRADATDLNRDPSKTADFMGFFRGSLFLRVDPPGGCRYPSAFPVCPCAAGFLCTRLQTCSVCLSSFNTCLCDGRLKIGRESSKTTSNPAFERCVSLTFAK